MLAAAASVMPALLQMSGSPRQEYQLLQAVKDSFAELGQVLIGCSRTCLHSMQISCRPGF